MLQPARRYMEDISDPAYRERVKRFADALTSHYARHPAVIAVGYDNEIGDGYMSYSAADRLRFIEWLKAKYGTVEALNKAWATQRWSRRLGSFDEVQLPNGDGPSPPERYLDLRRFWSDQAIGALKELDAIRQKNMPELPSASNLWDTAWRMGFDYLSSYQDYASYGAMGFYPGGAVDTTLLSLLVKGELPTPIWFNEFITAGSDRYGPPKGSIRMWAYEALLHYGQVFLAWTFNTHRGGEEQALFGVLDHDGTPSWKYQEWKQIAESSPAPAARLPARPPDPRWRSPTPSTRRSPRGRRRATRRRDYFSTPYSDQVRNAFQPLFEDNIDVALLNLANSTLQYKLLVVPGLYVMDERSASAIRRYVQEGGTVVMTAFSAKVDENSQWFDTPLPGRLDDVFGIRTAEFYRQRPGAGDVVRGPDREGVDRPLRGPRAAWRSDLGHVHQHPGEVTRRHRQSVRKRARDLRRRPRATLDHRPDPAQPLCGRGRREGAGDPRRGLGTRGRRTDVVRQHQRRTGRREARR